MIKLHRYLGIAGISEMEPFKARFVGKIFERLSIIIIFLVAIQWELDRKDQLAANIDMVLNLCVWFFFLIQLIVSLTVVKKKLRFLRQNWFLVALCIGGVFLVTKWHPVYLILQVLRPILVIWLLITWLDACIKSLSDNRLSTTLVTALIIVFLAGIVVAGLDPAIATPWDGIWWAWVTMSTVGYGDVVPVSGVGRIFGAILITMGLGLFSVITANFASIFIQREVREGVEEVKKESEEIRLILESIQAVKRDEETIVETLMSVQQKLADLEVRVNHDQKPPPEK